MTVDEVMQMRKRNLEALGDLAHDMREDAPDTAALLAWARREIDQPLRIVGPDGGPERKFTLADVQEASRQGQILGAEAMRRVCVGWLAEYDLNPCWFKDVGDRGALRMLARDASIALDRWTLASVKRMETDETPQPKQDVAHAPCPRCGQSGDNLEVTDRPWSDSSSWECWWVRCTCGCAMAFPGGGAESPEEAWAVWDRNKGATDADGD
jgi:hypothetical protein